MVHVQSYPETEKLKRIVELGDAKLGAEKWLLSGGILVGACWLAGLLASSFNQLLDNGGTAWWHGLYGRGKTKQMKRRGLKEFVPLWYYLFFIAAIACSWRGEKMGEEVMV